MSRSYPRAFSKFNELFLIEPEVEGETLFCPFVVVCPPFKQRKYALRSEPDHLIGTVTLPEEWEKKVIDEIVILNQEFDFVPV